MSLLVKTKTAIDDCKIALKYFDKEPAESEFRLTLILCLTLVRAIGNIIESEVKSNETMHKKNKEMFNEIKNNSLFLNFICNFRNLVLKEYCSSVSWASITACDTKEHRMEYLIKNGEFAGNDIRDLIKESIEFWEKYVEELEKITLVDNTILLEENLLRIKAI